MNQKEIAMTDRDVLTEPVELQTPSGVRAWRVFWYDMNKKNAQSAFRRCKKQHRICNLVRLNLIEYQNNEGYG